jgi:hypothetical protein
MPLRFDGIDACQNTRLPGVMIFVIDFYAPKVYAKRQVLRKLSGDHTGTHRLFGFGGTMDSHSFEHDRRKSKRYKMKDIAFAVLTSESDEELGQVINISHGGLAFEYFVGSRQIRSAKYLDIMLTKNELYINKISVRTIADFEIKNELPFSTIVKRQQSVCFETLTGEQEKQIDFLIHHHAQFSQ